MLLLPAVPAAFPPPDLLRFLAPAAAHLHAVRELRSSGGPAAAERPHAYAVDW